MTPAMFKFLASGVAACRFLPVCKKVKVVLRSLLITMIVAMLLVACGGGGGDAAPLPNPGQNSAPVANAGPNQNVPLSALVTLDGSKSTDADGDALTYRWTLVKPDGTAGDLDAANAVNPRFTARDQGVYVATLVVNDGHADSAPATVRITATSGNRAPVGNAGAAQSVKTGDVVKLDGSLSTDADGDSLTYAWTLRLPQGSAAQLDSATSAHPTFKPDVVGTYVATLIVNDGQANSEPVTVSITATAANAAPVANAGPAQSVAVGSVVTFDGSASTDANGDALIYSWTLTTKPAGSQAVLASSSTANPTLVADVAGAYVATLVVGDGLANSEPATVLVTATGVTASSIALFAEELSNGNLTRISWPYSAVKSSNIVCPNVCSAQVIVETFKLRVLDGSPITITGLQAKNNTADSPIVAAFDGLREGQVIKPGETASFSLYFNWVKGTTSHLTYTFTVKETGQIFKHDLFLNTY